MFFYIVDQLLGSQADKRVLKKPEIIPAHSPRISVRKECFQMKQEISDFFPRYRTTPARRVLPPERLLHESSGTGNRIAGLRHLFTKDLPEVEHTLPDLEPRLHPRPCSLLCKCRNVVKHKFTGAGLDIEPREPGKVCMDR